LLQNRASLGKPANQTTRDALDFFMQFYTEDKVWNESFPDSTTAFAQGKTAMYLGPSRRAVDIAKMNSDLRFKTVPLPQIPKNSPQSPDFSYATYWVEGVWNRSSDKDEAWKFLKFISSKESLEKLNSKIRARTSIERPSPYMDMAPVLLKDPIVGSVVKLAPSAKSWFLDSDTHDGTTGINSQVNEFYKMLVDPQLNPSVNAIKEKEKDLQSILTKYSVPREKW